MCWTIIVSDKTFRFLITVVTYETVKVSFCILSIYNCVIFLGVDEWLEMGVLDGPSFKSESRAANNRPQRRPDFHWCLLKNWEKLGGEVDSCFSSCLNLIWLRYRSPLVKILIPTWWKAWPQLMRLIRFEWQIWLAGFLSWNFLRNTCAALVCHWGAAPLSFSSCLQPDRLKSMLDFSFGFTSHLLTTDWWSHMADFQNVLWKEASEVFQGCVAGFKPWYRKNLAWCPDCWNLP